MAIFIDEMPAQAAHVTQRSFTARFFLLLTMLTGGEFERRK
jgi:hypothetical protein